MEDAGIDDAHYGIGIEVDGEYHVIGSGFASHYDNGIWTAAHVVKGLLDNLDELANMNPVALVVKAGTVVGESETYAPTGYALHPEYDDEGEVGSSPDVGIIFVDAAFAGGASLLPRDRVDELRVGQPIATLGFPTTLGFGTIATPTFKDGVLSALRPLRGSDDTRLLEVQHNFDTSRGTSGSAIFDHQGWMIAVSYAALVAVVPSAATGRPVSIGVGSLGFGIRVDAVWELMDHIEADESVAVLPFGAGVTAARGGVIPRRPYPSPAYQAFPREWNGQTIPPLTLVR